jgi:hypothetical protein
MMDPCCKSIPPVSVGARQSASYSRLESLHATYTVSWTATDTSGRTSETNADWHLVVLHVVMAEASILRGEDTRGRAVTIVRAELRNVRHAVASVA